MEKMKSLLLVPIWVMQVICYAQPSPHTLPSKVFLSSTEFKVVGRLPNILKEASGLYIDKNKNFWSHNDDRYPFLYCFDSTGTILKTVYLNHPNKGWEDLAFDKKNNVYIGAFGNNRNERKDLTIYKIGTPDTITSKVTIGETIKYQYEDQKDFPAAESNRNYDSDALIALGDSLYIFTKNRTKPFTGYTRIYRLPQTPGNFKAELVDSIFLGLGPMMDYWITGADLSPDQNTLTLLGHSKIWLIQNFKGSKFSTGRIKEVQLPDFTHKAGISFYDNNTLYIVDETEFEILGGNLYKLNIKELKKL